MPARWTNSCGRGSERSVRTHGSGVPDRGWGADEAAAVAGHRGALGERVEDDDVGAVLDLECRCRRGLAEPELRVRLVRAEKEAMLACTAGELLVERERRGRSGRIVGVTRPEDRDFVPAIERVEVGQPSGLLAQGDGGDLTACEARAAFVDRVSGGRHRDDPAAAQCDLSEREDRLLGAERRNDLHGRIRLDAEAPRDPHRHSLAELRQADGPGIRRHLGDAGDESLADEGRRRPHEGLRLRSRSRRFPCPVRRRASRRAARTGTARARPGAARAATTPLRAGTAGVLRTCAPARRFRPARRPRGRSESPRARSSSRRARARRSRRRSSMPSARPRTGGATEPLDERRVEGDGCGWRVLEDLDVAADELPDALLGRVRRAVGRVAEVERALDARGNDVGRDSTVESA